MRQARLARQLIEDKYATLTPREREVFAHVVSGQLNKQIAWDLGASEKTVKVHRARVMDKMRAQSLADLVRMAERLHGRPRLQATA
jgi:FixJ family two-component response regulator